MIMTAETTWHTIIYMRSGPAKGRKLQNPTENQADAKATLLRGLLIARELCGSAQKHGVKPQNRIKTGVRAEFAPVHLTCGKCVARSTSNPTEKEPWMYFINLNIREWLQSS